MEEAGENIEAGRGISDSLSSVILRVSTYGATFGGRDMSPRVFNGEETRGVSHRVIATGDRVEGKVEV